MNLRLNRKLVVIAVLYFAEGLPFGIILDSLPVYLRLQGVSLEHIGLMSLITLAWSIKFFWAPAVDRWGTYQKWFAAAQFLMAGIVLFLSTLDPGSMSPALWFCMISIAILSATQDIAVDAYSIRILETAEMGTANGVRVAAYRVALLVAGGLFVALGGWIGWRLTLVGASLVFILCAIFSLTVSPKDSFQCPQMTAVLHASLGDLFRRGGLIPVAIFIVLYKIGDMAMGPMVRPFWVDRGLSTSEMGFITGSAGIISSIGGALIGGVFTSRFGIFRGLWFLGLWQGLSNLAYAAVASLPGTGHLGVYTASIIESFCGGLGTSPFLAFLMAICNREHAATQYALFTALFGTARALSGAISGLATHELGFAHYFLFTFFMAMPAYLFLGYVKSWAPGGISPVSTEK